MSSALYSDRINELYASLTSLDCEIEQLQRTKELLKTAETQHQAEIVAIKEDVHSNTRLKEKMTEALRASKVQSSYLVERLAKASVVRSSSEHAKQNLEGLLLNWEKEVSMEREHMQLHLATQEESYGHLSSYYDELKVFPAEAFRFKSE